MGDSLKIQVIVDGSQVNAGMSSVTSTVDNATARIKSAFGSVANAPEGIRNALMILQNQAKMTGESVALATEAINAIGGSAGSATPAVTAMGAAASTTASQMTSMERAMALASGRMAGMLAGAGMMGGALGRVGAASATLGPLLAVAFPVIAAIALVDVLDKLWEKLRALSMEAAVNAEAWQKIDHEANAAMESIDRSIDAMNVKITDLTQGKMAALRLEMRQIGDGSIEMSTKMLSMFDQMGAQLEKEVPFLDKIKEFATFINTHGLILPNQGELAKMFGSALSETLDTKGLAAGIELVSNQISIVNRQLAANPGDKQLKEYASELIKILGLLQERQTLENKEKDANKAAQAKELATETEHASDQALAYAKALERAKLEAQTLADRARELAEAQAEFGAKAAGEQSIGNAKDTGERADAEREFQEARLSDQRAAAVASIEIEQDRVRELARQGVISASQEVAQLNALEAQKKQIETAYLDQRISTILARLQSDDATMYAEDLKEWSKLLSEKEKAEEKFLKDRQKNIDSATNQEQKSWTQLTNRINGAFDGLIQSLAQGNESIGRAFGKMLDSMLGDFFSFIARKAEKRLEDKALEIAENSSLLSTLLGLRTANQAAQQATDAVAAGSQVSQQAGIAGAAAFASIMEAVPFPANVAAAPAGMAAAISTVMGNLTLTSAEGGMDTVPHDMLMAVHKDESVLPAPFASGLRSLVAGGGQGHTFNQTINVAGGRDQAGSLARSGKQLVKMAMRELRKRNR